VFAQPASARGHAARRRTWLAGALLGASLFAVAGGYAVPGPEFALRDLDGALGSTALVLAAAYVLLLALPFVPAIELGIALMLVLGRDGVVLVYGCTQIALALAFAAGRMLPPATLTRWLPSGAARSRCGDPAGRACAWLGIADRAVRHRHLALAAALNLPGNAVLGGAGGLAFFAGASRLYSFPRFCLLVAVATSPVPILMLLCGVA
jgi:hypothetical protein